MGHMFVITELPGSSLSSVRCVLTAPVPACMIQSFQR